jgi:hypothetical protein
MVFMSERTSHTCDTNVILIKESLSEIHLEDELILEKTPKWCCGSRHGRNAFRVIATAIASTAGALLKSFLPNVGGIIGGGIVSGVANGASTWLSWESKSEFLLEARMMTDLTKVLNKVDSINEQLTVLCDKIQEFSSSKIFISESNHVKYNDDEGCFWLWRTRHRRNIIRLTVSGGVAAAGGLIGGFWKDTGGIITGAIVGGIGNGLSTLFSYEKTNSYQIRKIAFTELPQILKTAEALEKELIQLVRKIDLLKPSLFYLTESKSIECVPLLLEENANQCCAINPRNTRNFIYVNVTGWLSGAGAWISGFEPNVGGIIGGSLIVGVANSLSAGFTWEKESDELIERRCAENFSVLVTKVMELQQKVNLLSTFIVSNEPDSGT